MDSDTVRLAGRMVVGGFMLALVAAAVMFVVQLWQRAKGWWQSR